MSSVTERHLSWRKQTIPRKLGDDDIHLYFVRLGESSGAGEEVEYYGRLTDAEIVSSNKIKDPIKRRLYLGGRVGLRGLLENYTGIRNDKLKFGYGTKGKPRILNALEKGALEFNYTLSAGYALYGFSWNRPLGVDLELFPRIINTSRFAKRILTAYEMKSWMTIPQNQRNDSMLRCWTRKEAYGKLLGVGIRYVMNQAELFVNLNSDRWRTTVAGLLNGDVRAGINTAYGVQLQLPVPGAACLMYQSSTDNANPGDDRLYQEPVLSAFYCESPVI